jgi:hypothetical protein
MMRPKLSSRKGWHNFVGIAHQLGDLRVVEEFLRPGVEPRHLLCAGVKLNRGDGFGGPRGQDCGVAQAGCRIEDAPADRRDGRDLALRILPGIDILDAVHDKPGDQHAGRAPRWLQAAHAVSMLGEDLDGLDISLEGVL